MQGFSDSDADSSAAVKMVDGVSPVVAEHVDDAEPVIVTAPDEIITH